ncbi:MAG: FkbM family methyltransferase [Deltaproteobacteria bacterium]|nr:FkbM family methyltransferase [Deltaproteobacteria bacterium]
MRYIRLLRNVTNWWLHFGIKFGLNHKDPVTFRLRKGVVLEIPRRLLHEFKEIFMEECYTSGLALKVGEQPTVIDIGASVGLFSFFAASRFEDPRIISFEPVPANFHQLQRNSRLNRRVKIKCFRKAVYGHRGEIPLSIEADTSYTTAARVGRAENGRCHTINVPSLTLADIFEENDLQRCNMLKMDCEGSEYEILYNCPAHYLQSVDQMAIEVHRGADPRHDIQSLEAHLRNSGFVCRQNRRNRNMLYAWRRQLQGT